MTLFLRGTSVVDSKGKFDSAEEINKNNNSETQKKARGDFQPVSEYAITSNYAPRCLLTATVTWSSSATLLDLASVVMGGYLLRSPHPSIYWNSLTPFLAVIQYAHYLHFPNKSLPWESGTDLHLIASHRVRQRIMTPGSG